MNKAKRIALIVAWFAVLTLAGFFWLQLQWSRLNNDMNMYHLGKCSQVLDEQAQALAKCQLFRGSCR